MGSLAPTIMQGVGRLAGFANQAEADLATRTARGISDIASSGIRDGVTSAIVGGVGSGIPIASGDFGKAAEDIASPSTETSTGLANSLAPTIMQEADLATRTARGI
ncbi:MAG: hypothetical protein KDA29_15685, partial [Phycisphaerales bacterium]|nr:hypothetical protein [Phycisphaerales bacterium]